MLLGRPSTLLSEAWHCPAPVGVHVPALPMSEAPEPIQRELARERALRSEVERALRESLDELRRKEELLRRSEEQLRDFVENAVVGLHQVGPDGTILWANRAELELLGYPPEEYIGRSIADFHADPEVIQDILARLSRGEELHSYEARLRTKDGAIRHVLISSNVQWRDGQFVHTRCFTRDITPRKQAEEALRRREQQLQTITDALPVLVSFIGPDRRYQFVNAAYERWFGRPQAEFLGRRVEEILGEAAANRVRPNLERALEGQPVTYETELPRADGSARVVHATYTPQLDPDGRVTGVVGLAADVTEQRSFERYRAEAAARAERLLRITSALAAAVTPAEVFAAIVDQVAAATAASSVALWLVEEDGRALRLVRETGYAPSAAAALEVLPLDAGASLPALDAVRRGEPLWIASQEALLRAYPELAAVATPGSSCRVSCLPLASNGRTLGALGLTIEAVHEAAHEEERSAAQELAEEERGFLLLVARYASQAIERLRLLEAERRSRAAADAAAARMSVLGHASRVFVEQEIDLAARLEKIARELGGVLNGSVILNLLGRDRRLHTAALFHPDAEAEALLRAQLEATPLELGEGIMGAVAETGESVRLSAADPGELAARSPAPFRPFLERFPMHAVICAPLVVRGHLIGTVAAARTRAGEPYTPEDLEMLEGLAERAASAIENARLHRENVEARARAEQLYRFAHAAVSAQDVEEVFEAALGAIEGAFGTGRAAILLFDDDGVLRFRAWRQLSDEYRAAVEGHSPWPRGAASPQPVLVPDALHDDALAASAPLLQRERIGSLAFIPLVTRGRLLGKLVVYHARPHAYSTGEIELASAIADNLASIASRFVALAQLEQTVHYNELFAGVLAHDLRNPLGAIMTAAQLLLMRQEGEGDRSAKPLSRILSSGQRMSRMIDQLLDFTRARAGGGIEIQPRDTSLAELCAQAVGELELVFPSRTIECEAAGDLAGVWDPDRVLQIISNLVANAGQHAPAGSDISVKLDGRGADAVTLEVHNEGAIPESLLPSLFDPFRGTRQRRGHSQGLGLGLFIVKELVRAHGGTVDVASSAAHGTTFTIRLPRRPPPA
jgi:PAS domain S-box-containing protein